DEVDRPAEVSLARDHHPPVLARDLTDGEFGDIRGLDMRLAADAEGPVTLHHVPGKTEAVRGRAQDQRTGAGVEHDAYLLPIDRPLHHKVASVELDGPFREPGHRALGSRARARRSDTESDPRVKKRTSIEHLKLARWQLIASILCPIACGETSLGAVTRAARDKA